MIWRREGRELKTLASVETPTAPSLQLRMTAQDGELYRFAYSTNGRDWNDLGEPVNGNYIEGAHAALTASGETTIARFDWFRIKPMQSGKK